MGFHSEQDVKVWCDANNITYPDLDILFAIQGPEQVESSTDVLRHFTHSQQGSEILESQDGVEQLENIEVIDLESVDVEHTRKQKTRSRKVRASSEEMPVADHAAVCTQPDMIDENDVTNVINK